MPVELCFPEEKLMLPQELLRVEDGLADAFMTKSPFQISVTPLSNLS